MMRILACLLDSLRPQYQRLKLRLVETNQDRQR